MSVRSDFVDGSKPIISIAAIPREPPELPLLVLVVDDSGDAELVDVLAENDTVPAEGFRGDWGNVLEGGADEPVTFKFRLYKTDGDWRRAWIYQGPPKEMVDLITTGNHDVAILPRELAGALEGFNPRMLAGALILEVVVDDQLCEVLRYRSGYDY